MATVIIDGKELQIGDDERINVIQAANRLGIKIPHYCWHPGLSVVASCRMCLVEVGHRGPDGTVRMQGRLVPACQTPATDGTVVVTNSERVRANRKLVMEMYLLEHPVDCPVCDQAGECLLQDYYFNYGHDQRREPARPFHSRKNSVGPNVVLFTDRCIMCSRCVRFTREVSGSARLYVRERGGSAEIALWPDRPLDDPLSMNVVDLCPVGALCSRDFLYKQRVWFLKTHRAICTGCSTGCSVFVDENRGRIYRLRPRYNPQVNTWWMCDEGRLSYKAVSDGRRLQRPQRRQAGAPAEHEQAADWPELLQRLRDELNEFVARQGASALAVVLSPALTCEAAYLAAEFAKAISPQVRLALGPVPADGTDLRFPRRPDGAEPGETKFILHAEKCPNRLGVEAVLQHYEGGVAEFDRVVELVRAGSVKAVLLAAGYLRDWWQPDWSEPFGQLELFALIDNWRTGAGSLAGYVLPCTSWAEQAGSYVNFAGICQTTDAVLPPPADTRSPGRIFWELAGRAGRYRPAAVRRELAGKVPAFAPLAANTVPAHGVKLEAAS